MSEIFGVYKAEIAPLFTRREVHLGENIRALVAHSSPRRSETVLMHSLEGSSFKRGREHRQVVLGFPTHDPVPCGTEDGEGSMVVKLP